jgi:hypothetical protein
MPNREQFEAKFAPLGYTFGIDETDGEYLFADTHHAWLGWQAGAAAERERIAAKFNQPHMEYFGSDIQDFLRDRSAP